MFSPMMSILERALMVAVVLMAATPVVALVSGGMFA